MLTKRRQNGSTPLGSSLFHCSPVNHRRRCAAVATADRQPEPHWGADHGTIRCLRQGYPHAKGLGLCRAHRVWRKAHLVRYWQQPEHSCAEREGQTCRPIEAGLCCDVTPSRRSYGRISPPSSGKPSSKDLCAEAGFRRIWRRLARHILSPRRVLAAGTTLL